MSLLEEALNLLGDKVEDKSDEWLTNLVDKLDDLINDAKDPELREGGKKAVAVLKNNKDKFFGLGKKSFILFITHVAAERDAEAAKEYYRTKASARDIINSILDDAFDVEKVRRQKEEILAEALEVVKLIATGARYLLPFLLATV